MRFRDIASAITTSTLVACAVILTVIAVKREVFGGKATTSGPFRAQPDWASYVGSGHRLGSPKAKAVLVEFSDFQCPACRALEDVLRRTRTRFPTELAVVYRHWPLARIHPYARPAAIASECAGSQGRFDAMHDVLFSIKRDSLGVLPWRTLAERAGVTALDAFDQCLADSATVAAVDRDVAAAERLGAQGTPTVLIAGVRFSGSLPQVTMDSLVEQAIRKAR